MYLDEIANRVKREKMSSRPEGTLNGWLAVLACFLVHVATIGLLSTFGVYQQAYIETQSSFEGSSSVLLVSLIGSVANSGVGGMAIPAGHLAKRFGYRNMTMASGLLVALSLVGASYTTTYAQRLLTQGFGFALSYPLSYFPSMNLISQYFERRRGLAIGIATSGAGFGGLFIAPLTRFGITNYGIETTLRLVGISSGSLVMIAAMLMRVRFDITEKASKEQPKKSFRKFLQNPYFLRVFLIPFFVGFAYFIPFAFIPTFAVQNGMTAYQGAVIIGITNGANSLGRIILGLYGDFLGHINTLLISCTLAVLSVVWLWPFAVNYQLLTLFGILYGFWIGGYFALLTPTLLRLLHDEDGVIVTSSIYSGLFFGHLLGAPMVGFMLGHFALNQLTAMIFTGGFISMAVVSLFSLKISKGGKFFRII